MDRFADIAGLIRPDLDLPVAVTKWLEESVTPSYLSLRILRGHLHWTLLQSRDAVPLGGAGDPFEPLIVAMERGNHLRTDLGWIIAVYSFRQSNWTELYVATPLPDLSGGRLDQLDTET
ncbi:MAG: hypothetical protein AAB074_10410 [Planctomycetota bacterium]